MAQNDVVHHFVIVIQPEAGVARVLHLGHVGGSPTDNRAAGRVAAFFTRARFLEETKTNTIDDSAVGHDAD